MKNSGMIGLEIHAYVQTKEKLFCKCIASREKGLKENTNVCPICTGQPGAKPMLPNGSALRKAIQIGLMLGCKINKTLKWKRKHYDWADLPKGYQNTISGANAVPLGVNGKFYGIKIESMHLEEDPASWNPKTGCVDYNRSGLPLVEIVTAPDFSTSEEVVDWLKKLVHNLNYLKAIDYDAGIKADVNVNLENVEFSNPAIARQQALAGIPRKTERVEIKNLNSIENIGKAIEHELERQEREGGKVRETRRYDELKGRTMIMREKEGSEDYRFISEPDLPEIVLDEKMILQLKKELPESPDVKLRKFVKKHKIEKEHAEVLSANVDIAEFAEKVAEKINVKFALHWITGPLLRLLNENKKRLDEVKIEVEHFVSLLDLVMKGKITELQAKQILKKFYPKSFSPQDLEEKITSEDEIEKIVKRVLERNKDAIERFKKGDEKIFHFLMGEAMKESEKRADFKVLSEVLKKLLK
jgi:aspartyl-tRNA(Asn)/glutamyl-tRNA(Gln) amidotransferase subunit B